jgi:hypothetical protein
VKTLFDLIQEWRGVQGDAERIEVQARRTRQRATELEARITDALIQHGPVMVCTELFLPPENPNNPIRIQRVKDAIEIVVSEPEQPKL